MAIQDGLSPASDYRVVATIALRNAVTPKKEGLLVYVQADDTFYKLEDDLSTWTEFPNLSAQEDIYVKVDDSTTTSIAINYQKHVVGEYTLDGELKVDGEMVVT